MPPAQKSAISFALVHIPVEMHPATQDNDIRFNQLSRKTRARIRYKKIDESTGREIDTSDIVKAYQYEKGQYVVLEDEDFEKIKTDRDKSIRILQFTDQASVEPVFFKRSYYMTPQKGGEKAFALLSRAMRDKNRVAIGATVLANRETTLMLLPHDGGLLMETLYFADEIRSAPGSARETAVDKTELAMAERILDSMDKPFQPEQYRDEYQERLQNLIEGKIEGREISLPAEPAGMGVASLMDALKASIEQTEKPAKAAKPAKRQKQKAS